MNELVSDQDLLSYADEMLDLRAAARIEEMLRDNDQLRNRLGQLIDERDSGLVSVGEIWRHEKISCPTRAEWGLFLMQALDAARSDYLVFHRDEIGCAYCQATFEELQEVASQMQGNAGHEKRKERLFASSAGLLTRHSPGPSTSPSHTPDEFPEESFGEEESDG